jgi:hypothetical protein
MSLPWPQRGLFSRQLRFHCATRLSRSMACMTLLVMAGGAARAEVPAPTNLQGSVVPHTGVGTNVGMELTWVDNSTSENAFVLFERAAGTTDPFVRIAVLAPNTTRYLDANFSGKAGVVYRVRATQGGIASAWSNEFNWLPPGAPPAPGGLTAHAISGREVELRWNSVTTSGAMINIYRTVTGDWDQIESVTPSVTTYTDWRCRPGITYYYRLQVISNGIYSPWSAEVTATPP